MWSYSDQIHLLIEVSHYLWLTVEVVITLLLEINFIPLHFYERIAAHQFSLSKRNLKRIFTFTKKKKSKRWQNATQHLFAAEEPLQRRSAVSFEGRRRAPSLGLLSNSASFAPPLWAPVLYLDLFCAWLSKMCLKATASPLCALSAYGNFHTDALLLDNAGNLCIYHHNHIRQVRVKLNIKTWSGLVFLILISEWWLFNFIVALTHGHWVSASARHCSGH